VNFSLHMDVEPQFNLFTMTLDLQNYLYEHYKIPQEMIEHVSLVGDRIDFSLKKNMSENQRSESWYRNLAQMAS
jgi:hypothetical protein